MTLHDTSTQSAQYTYASQMQGWAYFLGLSAFSMRMTGVSNHKTSSFEQVEAPQQTSLLTQLAKELQQI